MLKFQISNWELLGKIVCYVPNLRFQRYINKWNKTKLSKILKIKSGKDQKPIVCSNGKFKIYGTGGVIGYTNTPIYSEPSVGIGRKGTIDKPFYFDKPFWTVDTLFYSEIFEDEPKFIYYLFQTINWKKYDESTGVPSLSSSTIENITVSVPTLPEQKSISNFLTKIDQRIETQNKIIKEYETLKNWIIDNEFSNNGNQPLGDFIKEKSTRNKNDNIVQVFSVNNKVGFINQAEQFEDRKIASSDTSNYKVVTYNDFAYNPARINVGSIARMSKKTTGIISPMYICFVVQSGLMPEYLEYYFKSKAFYNEMNQKLEGSVRLCLQFDGLRRVRLNIPTIEHQMVFSLHLTKLVEKIQKEKDILNAYKKQKAYLLQNMFI